MEGRRGHISINIRFKEFKLIINVQPLQTYWLHHHHQQQPNLWNISKCILKSFSGGGYIFGKCCFVVNQRLTDQRLFQELEFHSHSSLSHTQPICVGVSISFHSALFFRAGGRIFVQFLVKILIFNQFLMSIIWLRAWRNDI